MDDCFDRILNKIDDDGMKYIMLSIRTTVIGLQSLNRDVEAGQILRLANVFYDDPCQLFLKFSELCFRASPSTDMDMMHLMNMYISLERKFKLCLDVLLIGVQIASRILFEEKFTLGNVLQGLACEFQRYKMKDPEIHVRLFAVKVADTVFHTALSLDRVGCFYHRAKNPLCVSFHRKALKLVQDTAPTFKRLHAHYMDHLAYSLKMVAETEECIDTKKTFIQESRDLHRHVIEIWKETKDIEFLARKGCAEKALMQYDAAYKTLWRALHLYNLNKNVPLEIKATIEIRLYALLKAQGRTKIAHLMYEESVETRRQIPKC